MGCTHFKGVVVNISVEGTKVETRRKYTVQAGKIIPVDCRGIVVGPGGREQCLKVDFGKLGTFPVPTSYLKPARA